MTINTKSIIIIMITSARALHRRGNYPSVHAREGNYSSLFVRASAVCYRSNCSNVAPCSQNLVITDAESYFEGFIIIGFREGFKAYHWILCCIQRHQC